MELTLTVEAARAEATRCLRCDVCVRCGRCTRTCLEKLGFGALRLGYVGSETPGQSDFNWIADRCILCGACANACPTGAMAMKQENGQCILSHCGTTLCRDSLVYCDGCGEALGAVRFVSYLEKQVDAYHIDPKKIHLCRACKRMAATMEH